ncbi:MAG TPA: hypothetical protein PLB62_14540 [Candidatus Sumerlaeota bacterium]|nr:hypothetical protein [Candidatus Sumerlaeota bacterium]
MNDGRFGNLFITTILCVVCGCCICGCSPGRRADFHSYVYSTAAAKGVGLFDISTGTNRSVYETESSRDKIIETFPMKKGNEILFVVIQETAREQATMEVYSHDISRRETRKVHAFEIAQPIETCLLERDNWLWMPYDDRNDFTMYRRVNLLTGAIQIIGESKIIFTDGGKGVFYFETQYDPFKESVINEDSEE